MPRAPEGRKRRSGADRALQLVRRERRHRRHARGHQRRDREEAAAARHRVDRPREKGDGDQEGEDFGGKFHAGARSALYRDAQAVAIRIAWWRKTTVTTAIDRT